MLAIDLREATRDEWIMVSLISPLTQHDKNAAALKVAFSHILLNHVQNKTLLIRDHVNLKQ